MNIMLCASMAFSKEMMDAKKCLEKYGHTVKYSHDVEKFVLNGHLKLDFDQALRVALEGDSLQEGFEGVAQSDAILVLNYEKNRVRGYIGPSVIMEIGLASFLRKNIYILHEVGREQSCALEVALVKPIYLNGSLDLLCHSL